MPRSINKTDALSLVSAFGSIRAAVNARPEEIGEITGWGEKKVQRWYGTVRENFRVRKAAKRGIGVGREQSSLGLPREESSADMAKVDSLFVENDDEPRVGSNPPFAPAVPPTEASNLGKVAVKDTPFRPEKRSADQMPLWEPGDDEEEALLLAAAEEGVLPTQTADEVSSRGAKRAKASANPEESMNEGMAAALAKLRNQ